MKFGKLIVQAAQATQMLCRTQDWLNYKGLKQILNLIKGDIAKYGRTPTLEKLVSSPLEKIFFSTLRNELTKVFKTFEQLLDREMVKVEYFIVNYFTIGNNLNACISLHLNLCLLRNYAVLNYCGVRKILKKHDKMTGHCTQDQYMQKIMTTSVLAVHPRLTLAIEKLEAIYTELTRSTVPLTTTFMQFNDSISSSDSHESAQFQTKLQQQPEQMMSYPNVV